MKRMYSSKALLSASNIILIGVVIALMYRQSGSVTEPKVNESIKKQNTNPVQVFTQQNETQPSTQKASGQDRSRWIEKLREAGIPDAILVEVIVAENNTRLQKQLDEYQEQVSNGLTDENQLKALRFKAEQEKEADLRLALGEAGYQKWDQELLLKEINPGKIALTNEETAALYKMHKQMQSRLRDLEIAEQKGEIDAATLTAETLNAQAECTEQTDALLGTDRHALAQGTDTSASELVQQLANLNPTDAQIMELARARLEWTAQRAQLSDNSRQDPSQSGAFLEQQQAINDARDRAYEKTLGPKGFEMFQKQQSESYVKMKQYAAAWGMNDQNIDHVYGRIRSYEKNLQEAEIQARNREKQGQTVDWDAVRETQRQMSDQTWHELQNYLGKDRFEKLQLNGVIRLK